MISRKVWLLLVVFISCAKAPPEIPPPPPTPAPHPIPAWLFDSEIELDAGPSADDLLAVARSRERQGDSEGAIGLLERVLRMNSRHPTALWERGWIAFKTGGNAEATDYWFTLRQVEPDYPGLRRYLAIAEMRRERVEGVIVTAPRPGDSFSVAAVGDIQLGMGWPSDRVSLPPDSARSMFAHVAGAIGRADIGFGNLETALADSGESTKCRSGSSNCYAFRAPTAYARTLRASGFDVMSVNNNHAGDFGEAGRRSTIEALEGSMIRPSGSSGIASWETAGLRIALISFSTGEGPYHVPDIPGAVDAVRNADVSHDLVFVSFHGGAEGASSTRVPRAVERSYGENRGDVYALAHAVVDAGADLVLGHGPHVLRGMEIYKGRLIAYSLGNFSSWNGFNLRGPLGISAVLTVTLAINGVALEADLFPVELVRPGIPTPDASGGAIEAVRRLSQADFGDPMFDASGHWQRPTETSSHGPGTIRQGGFHPI